MRMRQDVKTDWKTALYSFGISGYIHATAILMVALLSATNSLKTTLDELVGKRLRAQSSYQMSDYPITINLLPHERLADSISLVPMEDGTVRVEGIPPDFPSMLADYKPEPADTAYPEINAIIRERNTMWLQTLARMDMDSYKWYLDMQNEIEQFRLEYTQKLQGLSDQVGKMGEELDEMGDSLSKMERSVGRLLMKTAFLGKSDINELFTEFYAKGRLDEAGFNDFFSVYLDAYIFFKGNPDEIISILRANKDITDIMQVGVEFDENGNFRFSRIRMEPKFQDRGEKVEGHYTTLLQSMPHQFISPTRCKLETPYGASYTIKNPEIKYGLGMERGPLSLERMVTQNSK